LQDAKPGYSSPTGFPVPSFGRDPPATNAFLLAAVAVAPLALRARFITLGGRLGVDPAGRRIFHLAALLQAVPAAWR
jgi:hypothetical protein